MLVKLMKKFGVTDEKSLYQLVFQFLKFGLVGLSNTAVSMGVYYIFLWIDPTLYMVGSILGTILSIANAFFWNDRIVFRSESRDLKNILKRIGKTYISYGGTSLLSVFLLWLEVSQFGVNKTLAPVINLIITIPLNFLINKLWTFQEKRN